MDSQREAALRQEVAALRAELQNYRDREAEWARTQAELEQSEEMFRRIFETIPDGLTITRVRDGKYLAVNDGWLRDTGHRREDVIGKTVFDIKIWPDDKERAAFIHRLRQEGMLRDTMLQSRFSDGVVRTVLQSTCLLMIDGEECILTAGKDIQDQIDSAEKFRILFDLNPNAMVLIDMETMSFVDINQTYTRLFGYEKEDLIGIPNRLGHASKSQETFDEGVRILQEKGRLTEFDYAMTTQTGEERSGLLYIEPVEVQGKQLHIITFIDLTHRQKVEADLRASKERYRTLFDSVNDFVFLHTFDTPDAPGYFLEVNQYTCRRLGYTPQEMRSLRPLDIISDADIPDVPEEGNTLVSQKELTFEKNLVTATGELIPVELRAQMITYKGETLVLSIGRDLTERKQAEIALNQLSQAIKQSPVSVVITDLDGHIQYVNPRFSQVSGYSAEEAIGQNPRILKSDVHQPAFYQEMWATLVAGHEWRGELCNRKKNGDLYWEQASIAGVRDDHGTITHFVAVKEDITDRKQAEQARARQERLAAVGQLAAGIAHDFNNILGTIILYGKTISRSQNLTDSEREKLAVIDEQAWHASRLIEQILDFSRRGVMERQRVDLRPLLKEQINLLSRTLPEHIRITVEHGPDEYSAHADPTRLQQMITNLAVNARDAMPKGGHLHFALAHVPSAPAHLGDHPPADGDGWLRLSVSDTGTGIPDDVLAHIFDPFFTTKAPGKGSGLGLAQVYGIVKQHRGYIDVESEKDFATTFGIYLPAFFPEAEKDPQPAISQVPLGQRQTVLVVEDQPFMRDALVDVLEQANYQVVAAANGEDALAVMAAQGEEIDLILSDVVMPQLGGFDLLKKLDEQGYAVPAILLTGHPKGDKLETLHIPGLMAWMTKPPDIDELLQVVHDAINGATPPTNALDI